MPKVSLCMIVRNEEEHLEACLQAAGPYADEIIIVDTGSEDRTEEIARQAGARLFRMKWEEHFAKARNYALHRATGDWILVLDADERLHPLAMDAFRALLADDSAAGYNVTIRQHRSEKGQDDSGSDTVCRLFRNNPGVVYRGRIHEDITVSLSLRYPKLAIKNSPLIVSHYGYTQTAIQNKDKQARNRRLLEQAMQEEPDSLYYRYAAAAEDFTAENYEAAAASLAPLLSSAPPAAGYAPDLAYKLSYAYWRTDSLVEALQAVEAGLARYPLHQELRELYGLLLLETGRPEQSLHAFRLLGGSAAPTLPEIQARQAYWMGQLHLQLCNWQDALSFLEQSLRHNTSYRDAAVSAWIDLAMLLVPVCDIPGILMKPPFLLPEEAALILACQYAMKWGCGAPLLELLEQAGERTAFYRAVLLTQSGRAEEAEKLLLKLLKDAPEKHLVLYLWGIQNRDIGGEIPLNTLLQYEALYPELALLSDRLLGKETEGGPSAATWNQAAYAALLTEAWNGFLLIWQHSRNSLPPSAALSFPAHWRPAAYRSPLYIRRSVLSALTASDQSQAGLGDRIFTALLAASLDDKAAASMLDEAIAASPQRLEPRAALYSLLANRHDLHPFLFLAKP